MNKNISLANKLLAAFLLVSLIPLGIFGIYSYYKDRADSRGDSLAMMHHMADHLRQEVDKHIAINQNLVRHFAVTREVVELMSNREGRTGRLAKFNDWLKAEHKLSPDFGAIYTIDLDGKCLASSRPDFIGANFGFREYFKRAAAGEYYKSDWSIGAVSGEPGVFVSAPVIAEGRVCGVIAIKIYVTKINDLIRDAAKDGYTAFIINPNGIFLSHSAPEFNYKTVEPFDEATKAELAKSRQFGSVDLLPVSASVSRQFLEDLKTLRATGTMVATSYEVGSIPMIGYLLKSMELPWVIGVSMPESAVYAGSGEILRNTLLALALALCSSMLVGGLLSRGLTRPLSKLSSAISDFGSGNITARAETSGSDEVGRLASAFNSMADTIVKHTKDLEKIIQQRTGELEEERLVLDVSLRAARVGVFSYDVVNKLGKMDNQFASMLGLDLATFRGTPEEFYPAIHPEDREKILHALANTKEAGVPYEADYRSVWPDGSVHYLTTKGELFLDDAGAPTVIRGVTWDESDKRTAEMERDGLREQLYQAHKMEALGTLAGGIAHDFNNILSAILGFAELSAQDAKGDPELTENLREIISASHRAKALVKEILAFSRKSNDSPQSIVLEPVIREAVNLLKKTVPATIAVECELGGEPTPPVYADPNQVHQVVMNLGTNAYQALAKTGGTIVFSLNRVEVAGSMAGRLGIADGVYLRLSVCDSGPGIPPEIVGRIFDPFFTTKPQGEGTGLGLSVAHGIVKKSNGAIAVETSEGRGATFSVYLPVAASESQAPYAGPPEPRQTAIGSVLIVDDEPALGKLLSKNLGRRGMETTYFNSPEKALEALAANAQAWDVVITDQTMPAMTGVEFLAALRREGVKTPVIICTGHSDLLDEEGATALGFSNFLRKPIDMAELYGAVLNALGGLPERPKPVATPPMA